jgi:hypothetical protein
MSNDLFEIPSRKAINFAKRRAIARKGYPEYNENQARGEGGQWSAGGAGGGSKGSESTRSGWRKLVAAAGGAAALATILATAGVPVLRSAPGLRRARNAFLGWRTARARQALQGVPPSMAAATGPRWPDLTSRGRYVRPQAEAVRSVLPRNLHSPAALRREVAAGRRKSNYLRYRAARIRAGLD